MLSVETAAPPALESVCTAVAPRAKSKTTPLPPRRRHSWPGGCKNSRSRAGGGRGAACSCWVPVLLAPAGRPHGETQGGVCRAAGQGSGGPSARTVPRGAQDRARGAGPGPLTRAVQGDGQCCSLPLVPREQEREGPGALAGGRRSPRPLRLPQRGRRGAGGAGKCRADSAEQSGPSGPHWSGPRASWEGVTCVTQRSVTWALSQRLAPPHTVAPQVSLLVSLGSAVWG